MVPDPGDRAPRLRWFLRQVRAGIVVYVAAALLLAPGPVRQFAVWAIVCGLLWAAGAAVIRLARSGLLWDLVAIGAIASLLSRGLGGLARRSR